MVAIILVCMALIFNFAENNTKVVRYHQHLEEPSAEEIDDVTSGNKKDLKTHLPIIQIDTNGQKIPGNVIKNKDGDTIGYEKGNNGEEEILAQITTSDTVGSWHTLNDKPDLKASAMIRYRGNTSRAFSKHGYRIEFVKADNHLENTKVPFLGMTADSEWALHGPFLDKTLIRNYMFMNISAEVMGYAPNVRFCEVVIDGKYQGLYVLMETIKYGEGRVDITEYNENSPITSYILRIDSSENHLKTFDNFTYYTKRLLTSEDSVGVKAEILYPTKKYQTKEVKEYIATDFNEIERVLYSDKMYDGSQEWKKFIDMDSFVDFYILNEFLMVWDTFSHSTYFYKDVRGKLHIGPVWDFNNSLDNFLRPINDNEFILAQKGWFDKLLTDEDFVEAVIKRYKQLRKGVLSDDYLNNYIDETIKWLDPAIKRNFEVWGYSFDVKNLSKVEYKQPSFEEIKKISEQAKGNFEIEKQMFLDALKRENPNNYEEAVKQLRSCIKNRGDWMDQNIEILRQYCADSKKASQSSY